VWPADRPPKKELPTKKEGRPHHAQKKKGGDSPAKMAELSNEPKKTKKKNFQKQTRITPSPGATGGILVE